MADRVIIEDVYPDFQDGEDMILHCKILKEDGEIKNKTFLMSITSISNTIEILKKRLPVV